MAGFTAGFSEHAHTADWELEVWAPDLPSLLEQAARGMYSLSGTTLTPSPRLERMLNLPADDLERLLVKFLGELLYFAENEGLGFDVFEFMPSGSMFSINLRGAPIASQNKEIKAVTFHNLAIHDTTRGLEVNIVFDV